MKRNKIIVTGIAVVIGILVLLYVQGFRLSRSAVIDDFEDDYPSFQSVESTQLEPHLEIRVYRNIEEDTERTRAIFIQKKGFLWKQIDFATDARNVDESRKFFSFAINNTSDHYVYVDDTVEVYVERLQNEDDITSLFQQKLDPIAPRFYRINYTGNSEVFILKEKDEIIDVIQAPDFSNSYWQESLITLQYQGQTKVFDTEDEKSGVLSSYPTGLLVQMEYHKFNEVVFEFEIESNNVYWIEDEVITVQNVESHIIYYKTDEYYLAEIVQNIYNIDSETGREELTNFGGTSYYLVHPFLVESFLDSLN